MPRSTDVPNKPARTQQFVRFEAKGLLLASPLAVSTYEGIGARIPIDACHSQEKRLRHRHKNSIPSYRPSDPCNETPRKAVSPYCIRLESPCTNLHASKGAGQIPRLIRVALTAVGFGVGLGWPHKVIAAEKQNLALAPITMAQLLAPVIGAALIGRVVNMTGLIGSGWRADTARVTLWLFATFARVSPSALPIADPSARIGHIPNRTAHGRQRISQLFDGALDQTGLSGASGSQNGWT